MQVVKTSRGFEIVQFDDHNGHDCSLQQSSAIDENLRGAFESLTAMLAKVRSAIDECNAPKDLIYGVILCELEARQGGLAIKEE